MRTARADVAACERQLGAAERQVSDAQIALGKARKIVDQLEAELAGA